MERIRVKIIRRGKQIGFIVPRRTVKKLGIKPGDDVEISFLRKQQQTGQNNLVRSLFGSLKGIKVKQSTDELMREIDRELYPEDFKGRKKVRRKLKRRKSLLAFKSKDWGEGTEHLSEEIDKVLY